MSERFETVSMSVFEWVLEACMRQCLSPEEVKEHAQHLAEIRRLCKWAQHAEPLLKQITLIDREKAGLGYMEAFALAQGLGRMALEGSDK